MIVTETRIVPQACMGQRLDVVAAALFEQHSRTQLQKWIKTKSLHVDGQNQTPSHCLRGGEHLQLRYEPQPTSTWNAEDLELNLVYEDQHLLVVDKQAGLAVHPGAGRASGTLVNGLLARYPELEYLPRCGIVHRLDKDTSGLLVIARSQMASQALSKAISSHRVTREYLALVKGIPPRGGVIDAPLGRHPVRRKKMAVVANGRRAITRYQVLESLHGHTLLRVHLETGRTHQIRVHLSHIGFPLVGDPLYGCRRRAMAGDCSKPVSLALNFPRQALHAQYLALRHPVSRDERKWFSSLPPDFRNLLKQLNAVAL